jgi:hypothetical protein
MTKGDIVGIIVFIDVKDGGRLRMSKNPIS